MQKRLITFGCSYTYGHGLDDCFVPPIHAGKSPSKLAWPSLVSNSMNFELVNNSQCGSSNLEILFRILQFNFISTDQIIIMWSFPDRDMVFRNGSILQIIWQDKSIFKHWSEVHTEEDMAIRTWFYIQHSSLFLQSKNLKYYNIFANYNYLKNYRPNFMEIDFLDYDMSEKLDYALDNKHPGPITHKRLAERIMKKLSKCK